MKPTWLIERGGFPEHVQAFKSEVEHQGMACFEVDYQPGREPPDDITGVPPLAQDACVVLWGTLPLMRQIQLRRAWLPGGWCNSMNLECAAYYAYFGEFLLNSHYTILPGVEAIRLEEQLFAEFGVEGEIFVRPSCVHKLFTGTVVYKDNFRQALAPSRYDPQTLVVVSTPKEIRREWRMVVAGGVIVASSQYRDTGAVSTRRGCPEDVQNFASQILNQVQWKPDDVFMMDICESEDRLHLLELNSFSCSGLYDCDLSAVIRATSVIAEKSWMTHRAS